MNIYLAAGFGRRLEMKALAARLRQALDCCIVSRWLDCDSGDDGTEAPETITGADVSADIDLEAIRKAQVLVCVAEPGRAFSRGGRHFETGFAYALGKTIIVLGEREHVFHMLPGTMHVTDEAALIQALRQWEGKAPDPIEPAYYRDRNPEPIDVVAGWNLCFRLGAVVKYIARWEKKGGVEDLKKARWYLSHLIDELERKEHGQVVATNATGS